VHFDPNMMHHPIFSYLSLVGLELSFMVMILMLSIPKQQSSFKQSHHRYRRELKYLRNSPRITQDLLAYTFYPHLTFCGVPLMSQ